MATQNSIESYVRQLAREHFEFERELDSIVWFKDSNDARLLAVTEDSFPVGKVLVFSFRGTDEYPYPLRIGEVTPEEWARVEAGEIPLPEGWDLRDAEIIRREIPVQ